MDGWEVVARGCTEALVRRSPDGRSYAKTGTGAVRAELADERDRLEWLAAAGVPVPRIQDWSDDGRSATLTTASLPGVPMSELAPGPAAEAATSLGGFLRRLHALDHQDCPFERWLAVTVPLARLRVEQGLVDEGDLDEEREDRSPDDLLRQLLAERPRAEQLEVHDLVVCHGDACLPNFLCDPETLQVTGTVDVGRLGVADRHLDLALAVRSSSNTSLNPSYGATAAEAMLAAYGLQPDPWRLDFYRLLDEFF